MIPCFFYIRSFGKSYLLTYYYLLPTTTSSSYYYLLGLFCSFNSAPHCFGHISHCRSLSTINFVLSDSSLKQLLPLAALSFFFFLFPFLPQYKNKTDRHLPNTRAFPLVYLFSSPATVFAHMSTLMTETYEARSASFPLRREVRQAMVVATSASNAKSCRRPPHKTTEAQKRILLAEFEADPNPPAARRDRLAKLLNVERRIIKNWFSNQRALRRKTGQGYRGWATGSASSHSASGSGDELELEPELKIERASTPAQSSIPAGALTFDQQHITDSTRFSPNPELRPQNVFGPANSICDANENLIAEDKSYSEPLKPSLIPKTIYREFQPSPLRCVSSPITTSTLAPIMDNNSNNNTNNITNATTTINNLSNFSFKPTKSKSDPYALPSLLSFMSVPSSWIPAVTTSPQRILIEPSSVPTIVCDDDDDDDSVSSWSSEVSTCPGYPESALRSSLAIEV